MKTKQDSTIVDCCLQEIHYQYRNTYGWKVNGWKKTTHRENCKYIKAIMVKLTSNKGNFNTRDKGHFIMIKSSYIRKT